MTPKETVTARSQAVYPNLEAFFADKSDFEAAVSRFTDLAARYEETGQLPIDVPRWRLNWDAGVPVAKPIRRPYPRDPKDRLDWLDGSIKYPFMRMFRFSAREAGLGGLADFVCAEDLHLLVSVHKKLLKRCGGKLVDLPWAAKKGVGIDHGWTGSGASAGDLVGRILQANPDTLVIHGDKVGYARSQFGPRVRDWMLAKRAGIYTHAGTNFYWGLLERAAGLRQRLTDTDFSHLHRVGHSEGGAAIVNLNEYELTRPKRGWTAITTANASKKIGLGNYAFLGLTVGAGGHMPGVLNLLRQAVARSMVWHFTEGSRPNLARIHNAVIDYAEGIRLAWRPAEGIYFLYQDQGLRKGPHRWPHFFAYLGAYDPLVNSPRVFEMLREAGVEEEQIDIGLTGHNPHWEEGLAAEKATNWIVGNINRCLQS